MLNTIKKIGVVGLAVMIGLEVLSSGIFCALDPNTTGPGDPTGNILSKATEEPALNKSSRFTQKVPTYRNRVQSGQDSSSDESVGPHAVEISLAMLPSVETLDLMSEMKIIAKKRYQDRELNTVLFYGAAFASAVYSVTSKGNSSLGLSISGLCVLFGLRSSSSPHVTERAVTELAFEPESKRQYAAAVKLKKIAGDQGAGQTIKGILGLFALNPLYMAESLILEPEQELWSRLQDDIKEKADSARLR